MARLPVEIMPFGDEHKGERIEDIASSDPDYLVFIWENLDLDDDLEKSIRLALAEEGVRLG